MVAFIAGWLFVNHFKDICSACFKKKQFDCAMAHLTTVFNFGVLESSESIIAEIKVHFFWQLFI